ncbi:acyl-CoA synthetase [Sphingomonas oligophenolica]|uniref:Acyl-CoA synthetase n=1 Tax=Sphingomonas oligophenolica TaxID=301154 RepID=A0ABU9Y6A2_9SPHN
MIEESISTIARDNPDKPAIVMGSSGRTTTFGDLERRSNQNAHLMRSLGIDAGGIAAFCLENRPEIIELAWGAMRGGIVIVPISSKLTAVEIDYVVRNSGARLLVTSPGIGDAFGKLPEVIGDIPLFSVGDADSGFRSWRDEAAKQPGTAIMHESLGGEMLYSSGTTGRPKGIRWTNASAQSSRARSTYGLCEETVLILPAPLYHSAPFRLAINTVCAGGTVVVMERFDPEHALSLIERYRATLSLWVPTHFVRMLKLPKEVRDRYDVSSLQLAVHAAAPCPVPVKHAMIEWFGPIIFEYFGSTEQTTITSITTPEWLRKPGSVGAARYGRVHICDADGKPVPAGTIGTVFHEGGQDFIYHGDPEKTAAARNEQGWTTVGDVGYLDEDGYLFLTDRGGFMIITGGVNVYPQEIENLLVTHPRVADAAVIGVPDLEMGEIVTAIVQPLDMKDATPAFAEELRDWLRGSLSGVKVPKRIEFEPELPRLPTGKMQKFLLRERYARVPA